MRDRGLAIFGWYRDLPDAEGIFRHWSRTSIPAISNENLISFAEVELGV